jgi:ABC-2 type transport system permease protein
MKTTPMNTSQVRTTLAVYKRELAGYFTTPVGYVFIVVFLFLSGVFTFQVGELFEREQADLRPFFTIHPWLYLFLVPAVAMRLWAEERRTGTIELLMTLPISTGSAVLGKFLAAWSFTGIALAMTFPTWLTVIWLGDPDNGAILAGYAGSFLMAGGFLAIGSCISAVTKNQVIAFVLTVVVCLFFLLTGLPFATELMEAWMPVVLLDALTSFSFLEHFSAMSRGVVRAEDLVFFGSLMGLALFANTAVLEIKKAD